MAAENRLGHVSSDPFHRNRETIRFFPPGYSGTVLDIGGFQGSALSRYAPDGIRVISLNLYPESHNRRPDVYGNGLRLPFGQDSGGISTAIDVMAHLPPYQRRRLLEEMHRVAPTSVISTPIRTPRSIQEEGEYEDKNSKLELAIIISMQERGLSPKGAFVDHRWRGLPSLDDLVEYGRNIGAPFKIFPSTNRSTLFQSMNDQVAVLACDTSKELGQKVADQIAQNAEGNLDDSLIPPWEEAYRAMMVISKDKPGKVVEDEDRLYLSRNEIMAYQAALRAAGWGHVKDEDVLWFYKNNPLRGRNIVIEGPEGSGKTTLVRALVNKLSTWGYDLAVQTDFGLRQRIRDLEKTMKRIISDPERAEFFAFAMIEAAVAGNAYTLLGPCTLSINDRGMESARMHHGWHCPDNVTIPFLLERCRPISIPPDLTIVLGVPDPELNYHLMQKDGGLVNATKGPDALVYQRKFYQDLVWNDGSQFTGPVCYIKNPGVEGTFESVVEQALEAIGEYCKIPTRR